MSLVLPEGVRERTPLQWQDELVLQYDGFPGRQPDLQYARKMSRIAASLFRANRRGDEEIFMEKLQELGPHLLVAARYAHVSMSEALALKYDRCFYCRRQTRCICTPKEKAERPILIGQASRMNLRRSLDGWQRKLFRLYGVVNAANGVQDSVSHLEEEVLEAIAEVCDPPPEHNSLGTHSTTSSPMPSPGGLRY